MSFVSIAPVVFQVAETEALPVSSVVYPLIAAGVFVLLGFVTWSYRDVANRHANKTGDTTTPGAGHH